MSRQIYNLSDLNGFLRSIGETFDDNIQLLKNILKTQAIQNKNNIVDQGFMNEVESIITNNIEMTQDSIQSIKDLIVRAKNVEVLSKPEPYLTQDENIYSEGEFDQGFDENIQDDQIIYDNQDHFDLPYFQQGSGRRHNGIKGGNYCKGHNKSGGKCRNKTLRSKYCHLHK
jgi:hypothetical protein